MNMKRFCCIAAICLGIVSLHAAERNQNIKIILEKTYLAPQSEPLLNMLALQALASSEKNLSSSDAVKQLRETFYENAVFGELAKAYECFSDTDLDELRKIHENPVFQKYSKNASGIVQKHFTTLSEAFRSIVEKYGVAPSQEEDTEVEKP